MGEVDPAFIQALEHRPAPQSAEGDEVPLIDLYHHLISPTPDPTALEYLVAQIGEACKNWGFFQVINHGVSPILRGEVESFSRKFFALSKQEKMKVSRDEVNPIGYYDTEHTKNVRDWKEVFDFFAPEPAIFPASPDHVDSLIRLFNQWPQNLPGMRETCMEYAKKLEKLAFKLLELIALSLGLKGDRFNEYFEDQISFIRLNHYPPCPSPDLALGVGRHKDSGGLTILGQDDVGGLQVKRKTDGQWILVKPVPDSYIINVGDLIQVWSNDRYESVEHRVKVNLGKERFSIPYFFNASHYTMVKPLEELVDEQNPPKYAAYNWGKFFSARKRSNFKKLSEENVQIYHFKAS